MALFHQPNEMQVRQSRSQRRDRHPKLHASKATQRDVSIEKRRGSQTDGTFDTLTRKKTSWNREWKHRRLSRCKVHDVGMSNPWLAGFGKLAYVSSAFHTQRSRRRCPFIVLAECTPT
eukprot:scaffold139_cov325-Pavlova_lutheri.AAC.9